MRIASGNQLSPTQNLIGNGMQASAKNESVATDPYFASVVLLAGNDNAADGTTTFVDQSNNANVISRTGAIAYPNASVPIGMTPSVDFPGAAGDKLSMPDQTWLHVGTGDFTFEFYVNFDLVQNAELLTKWGGTATNWLIDYNAGNLRLGIGGTVPLSRAWTPTAGIWYHVASPRSGTTCSHWIDGTQLGTTAASSANDASGAEAALIGNQGGSDIPFNGKFASVRITKGVARYTGTFTSPTLPLQTS